MFNGFSLPTGDKLVTVFCVTFRFLIELVFLLLPSKLDYELILYEITKYRKTCLPSNSNETN